MFEFAATMEYFNQHTGNHVVMYIPHKAILTMNDYMGFKRKQPIRLVGPHQSRRLPGPLPQHYCFSGFYFMYTLLKN